MKLPIFIGFTILAAAGHAQIVPGSTGHGQPTFNCAINDTYGDIDTNLVWQCKTQPNGWVPTPGFMPWGGSSNAPVNASDAILKLPRVDVRSFKAVGDGTTDNCTALTNAANYALSVGAVLYFPPSTGYFGTSCTVPFLGNWIVDGNGPMAIAGGTAASTALVSTGTSQIMDHKGIYGPGTINGNALSPTIIWVMQGRHINIAVSSIVGMAVNGKGVYFGDDAGVGGGGYEGAVYDVGFGFHSNPTHTGSSCIYISTGNGTQGQFTDDNIHDNILHDCATGYQDNVGHNNRFTNNHAWDQALTTCFEELANGGTFTNEYCDTPTTYGFRIHQFNSVINGGTAYTNGAGVDNTATAIFFDQSADPSAFVSAISIYGNDATHRWAADTNLGFSASTTVWCNIRNDSNVVVRQQGSSCLSSAQIFFGGITLKNSGAYGLSQTPYTCSGTCAMTTNGGIQKVTLTGSVTSSTYSTTQSGSFEVTFMICQNATGGFTFTPPANSVGFGTIGTTASKCSLQLFNWDGTTLRAASTMQTNE